METGRYLHLYNTVIIGQFDVIQQVWCNQLVSDTDAHIPFRVNDTVNAQLIKCSSVKNGYSFGYNRFDSQLFEQNGSKDTRLNIVANSNDATVKITNAEGA
ncbi:hypothetical protein D3C74_422220 [compost metagenome]